MDLRYGITAEERAALYNEVWTDPFTTVAKRYQQESGRITLGGIDVSPCGTQREHHVEGKKPAE